MNTGRKVHFFTCAILVSMLFAMGTTWAAGNTVMYQGTLAKPDGTAVPDGTYSMAFKIYDALEAGATLWVESGLSVQITGGAFAVELGSITPFGTLFESGAPRWLAIAADLGAGMNAFDPRVPFTMVPHAGDAATLDGNDASDFAPSTHAHAAAEITGGTLDDARVPAAIARDSEIMPSVLSDDGTGSTLDADLLDGLHATSFWNVAGNAGTTPATQFLGTTDDVPLELRVSNTRALRIEPNADRPNLIGGYSGNEITAGVVGAAIGGGGETGLQNHITDNYGTIGGGRDNQAGDNEGLQDSADDATVGGGRENTASGNNSTVSGGYGSKASNTSSTVGGGFVNDASGISATVGGGGTNAAIGDHSTVGGGMGNQAQAKFSTIAGGGPSEEANPTTTNNRVTDDYGAIGGGGGNQAGDNAGTLDDRSYATVGGGKNNNAENRYATVGGGGFNKATGFMSTVGGGNANNASAEDATVGGGDQNNASGNFSTVGGGKLNKASGENATVSGGNGNDASGKWSTVGGGLSNDAIGEKSFAAGFRAKANHNGSFVWGDNTAADVESSYANQIKLRAGGGMHLIADSSSGKNPAALRVESASANGVGIFINDTSSDVNLLISNPGTGDLIKGYSGTGGSTQVFRVENDGDVVAKSFTPTSDRNAKENFTSVDARDILDKVTELPMSTWNFKGDDADTRHLGPMAQDFHAAFGLGNTDKGIATTDLDGVALAAIQGLNTRLKEKDSEIAALRSELEAVKSMVQQLANK